MVESTDRHSKSMTQPVESQPSAPTAQQRQGDVPKDMEAVLAALVRLAAPVLETHGVEHARFRAFMEEASRKDDAASIRSLLSHASDLAVVCAALEGRASAMAHVDGILTETGEYLMHKRGWSADLLDEASQRLRVRLLTEERRLKQYTGRGTLVGYLRLSLAREVLCLMRARGRANHNMSPVLPEHVPAGDDLEMALLRRTYREPYRQAFAEAFSNLQEEEQRVLCLAYRMGLGIDGIAERMGIHRATAARRLIKARAVLYRMTRTHLCKALGISRDEASSILRNLHNNVSVSLEWMATRKPG